MVLSEVSEPRFIPHFSQLFVFAPHADDRFLRSVCAARCPLCADFPLFAFRTERAVVSRHTKCAATSRAGGKRVYILAAV